MKKLKMALFAIVMSVTLACFMPVKTQAAHSSFFEFNQEFFEELGYSDNLWMIQNSLSEFNSEDVLWMAQNDCLDETGIDWCAEAGLLKETDLKTLKTGISHKKPQTIFD